VLKTLNFTDFCYFSVIQSTLQRSKYKNEMHTDLKILAETFPLANQRGADCSLIQTDAIRQAAKNNTPLTLNEIKIITKEHHLFLDNGGGGGKWHVLVRGGITFGLYLGNDATAGTQAVFERKHLAAALDLQEFQLPFANFCGVWGVDLDLSDADLSYCLFADAALPSVCFADANLSFSDFSRADLSRAVFVNANLQGADFENCNLNNADFRGANLTNARFPGAILKGVKF
jgi:uncharacterized protein YjbI with pentapeptide repeats